MLPFVAVFCFVAQLCSAAKITENCASTATPDTPYRVITRPIQHGEGPYWSDSEQVLYYVDTFKANILRVKPESGPITEQKVGGDSVGAIFPIKGKAGKFLVAGDRSISLLSWDGKRNNSGVLEPLVHVDEDKPTNQFNDGKIDALGRLWAGTLTRNADLSVTNNGGSLYTFFGKNLSKPIEQQRAVSISNGIAWSKNNKKMFYIDSETRKVVVFDFDLKDAKLSNQRVLFDLENHPEYEGIPDGMTIDIQDNLYVALFGGGGILKIDSRTGKRLDFIKLPVTYVTSVTFGGPQLKTLYATTSRLKLDNKMMEKEPYAGSVFAITCLGNTKGLKANEFVLK